MTEEQERAAARRRSNKRWAALNALAGGQDGVSQMLQSKAHAKKMAARIEAGEQPPVAEVDKALTEYMAGRTITAMSDGEMMLAQRLWEYSGAGR